MSLQFAKEAVTLQPKTHGFLSSTLAAPRPDAIAPVPAVAPALGRVSKVDGVSDSSGSHPWSVRNVIDAILHSCRADTAASGLDLPGDASSYSLLVAEDDGQVDIDFPEIDSSVTITTVGIDKFVLCHRGSDTPALRVVIPSSALALRAFEVQGALQGGSDREGAGPVALSVTCYPAGTAGTRSFSVTLPS